MARYIYLVTSLDPDGWARNGVFQKLSGGDRPHKYDERESTLKAAKDRRLNYLLKYDGSDFHILKFGFYEPYTYYGEVQ